MAINHVTKSANCAGCGETFEFVQTGTRPKRFCSRGCYQRRWWEQNASRLYEHRLEARRRREGAQPRRNLRAPGDTEWWCFACESHRPVSAFARGQYRCKRCWSDYYAENAERIKSNVSAWAANNPELVRASAVRSASKRRTRMAGNGAFTVTARDLRRTLARFHNRCAYCDSPLTNVEWDHVVPVARGGSHSVGNLVPSCMPCNRSKSDHLVTEWSRRPVR